jgi:hypothetical protein
MFTGPNRPTLLKFWPVALIAINANLLAWSNVLVR